MCVCHACLYNYEWVSTFVLQFVYLGIVFIYLFLMCANVLCTYIQSNILCVYVNIHKNMYALLTCTDS